MHFTFSLFTAFYLFKVNLKNGALGLPATKGHLISPEIRTLRNKPHLCISVRYFLNEGESVEVKFAPLINDTENGAIETGTLQVT